MADNIEITEEDLARNFGPGQTGDADVQAEVQANVPATVDAGSSKKAWWIAGGVVVGVAALAGGIAYMRRRSAVGPQGGVGGSSGIGGGGVVIPGGVPQGSPEPGVDLPSGTPTPQASGGWINVLPLPTAADVPGFDLSANWGKTPTDMRPLFALMERASGIAGSGRIFAAIAKRESGFQPGAHNDSKEERDASRRAYANAKDRNPALKYGAQAAEFGSGGLFAGLAPYFLWTGVPEVGGKAPLLGSPPEIMFLPRVSAWFGCVYLQRLVTYYRLDDHIDIKVGWASPSLLKTGRGGSTYKAVRTRFTSDLAELGIDIDDTSTIPAKLDASRWPGALRAFELLVGALPTRSGG